MTAVFDFCGQKFISVKHQLKNLNLFSQAVNVRVFQGELLVVEDKVPGRSSKITLFLLLLNPLQPVIRRDAPWAVTGNAAVFKLTHCNVNLMILGPGIRGHRNGGGGPNNPARISKTLWPRRCNMLNSTMQTVY